MLRQISHVSKENPQRLRASGTGIVRSYVVSQQAAVGRARRGGVDLLLRPVYPSHGAHVFNRIEHSLFRVGPGTLPRQVVPDRQSSRAGIAGNCDVEGCRLFDHTMAAR